MTITNRNAAQSLNQRQQTKPLEEEKHYEKRSNNVARGALTCASG